MTERRAPPCPVAWVLVTAVTTVACSSAAAPTLKTATGLDLMAEVPVPPHYGVHDTFVRDGVAFVCAWNTGVIILDVGGAGAGGSPALPVELGRVVTASGTVAGARAHNAWWFHNPVRGEQRYLFVGQEGPGQVGFTSSGAIHVVDVTDFSHPTEVAHYAMTGTVRPAGAHNFWMDEGAQILFAAYYNGGVVALDVSGVLDGDLSAREVARILPSGGSTYVWGVQWAHGSLYATDMVNGLFQLRFAGDAFSVVRGGEDATERYASDLWVTNDHAYTGTWGNRGRNVGDVLNVWRLDAMGRAALARPFAVDGIGTVADVQVSDDGGVLLIAAERGAAAGLHVYGLRDPERPRVVAVDSIPQGVHTATLAEIGGELYAFAARNPPNPALLVYRIER